MSFPGDPVVEEFLEKFVREGFAIDYESHYTKRLIDALTRYQLGKSRLFLGPYELSKSEARTAIANAKLSGAIKEKEGKGGESLEKNQDKPKIDPLEEVKQEFIKYFQEHPPQQPVGEQNADTTTTTTVGNPLTVVYDIAAKEVENAKNTPPEKKMR